MEEHFGQNVYPQLQRLEEMDAHILEHGPTPYPECGTECPADNLQPHLRQTHGCQDCPYCELLDTREAIQQHISEVHLREVLCPSGEEKSQGDVEGETEEARNGEVGCRCGGEYAPKNRARHCGTNIHQAWERGAQDAMDTVGLTRSQDADDPRLASIAKLSEEAMRMKHRFRTTYDDLEVEKGVLEQNKRKYEAEQEELKREEQQLIQQLRDIYPRIYDIEHKVQRSTLRLEHLVIEKKKAAKKVKELDSGLAKFELELSNLVSVGINDKPTKPALTHHLLNVLSRFQHAAQWRQVEPTNRMGQPTTLSERSLWALAPETIETE
ncbi:hypothetical protein B0H63DRAFT_560633 [Podospora didyma]|uniref:Uncharacterized protein n=1 Tax=Podospora didyma TaxID=330526 RepID=A0AAE0NR83_9PEZI|nr:hypothetical protein B0H63DRAFT_560633 [Podospora didyma]